MQIGNVQFQPCLAGRGEAAQFAVKLPLFFRNVRFLVGLELALEQESLVANVALILIPRSRTGHGPGSLVFGKVVFEVLYLVSPFSTDRTRKARLFVVSESVLKELPHSLNADVAHWTRQHHFCLALEVRGHSEAGVSVHDIMLGKLLDGVDSHTATVDVACSRESMEVIDMSGQDEVFGEALAAVITLERLLQCRNLPGEDWLPFDHHC